MLRANPITAAATEAAKNPATALNVAAGALSTATTVQAARLLASPAARATAGLLSKAFVPLTIGLAAYDAVKGYQKDGIKGAATGVADSLSGGLFSMALDRSGLMSQPATAAPPAASPGMVSDRLAVARGAADRTSGEMGQTGTLNQGSMRPATTEVTSDGNTDDYFRTQNGRRVQVSGYKTPTR